MERTLALLKPDAVAAGHASELMQLIDLRGFTIIAKKKLQLSKDDAGALYAEHAGKPFFEGLVAFMTSGPIWALVLSRINAIKAWRELMGPTNALQAKEIAPKSLRALYGSDGTRNATHGSDSPGSATREIGFFFPTLVMDPTADPAATQADIEQHLQPTLLTALTALAKQKPTSDELEAVAFLGKWLLDNNPNKPRVVLPPGAQPPPASVMHTTTMRSQPAAPSGRVQGFTAGLAEADAIVKVEVQQQGVGKGDHDAAATKVQAAIRGHLARKHVAEMRHAEAVAA